MDNKIVPVAQPTCGTCKSASWKKGRDSKIETGDCLNPNVNGPIDPGMGCGFHEWQNPNLKKAFEEQQAEYRRITGNCGCKCGRKCRQ